MAEVKPYSLPIEDIRKALQPYIPPKPWEPSVGELAVIVTPVKVYRDLGNKYFEVCDSEGGCLKVSRKELVSYSIENKSEISMKAMKDAVLTVAKQLAKANNTVTTLEIKTELRRDYPYYFWTQATVSNYMDQLAGDGIFTYTDNGTYRTYSLATQLTSAPLISSTTISKVAGTLPTKKGRTKKSSTIPWSSLPTFATSSGFESVTLKNGKVVTKSDIKNWKKSPIGYISPKVSKIQDITISGKTYIVK